MLGFLASLVRLEVGDGRVCHVWIDHWLSGGLIFERYGERVIYDAASVKGTRLSTRSLVLHGN